MATNVPYAGGLDAKMQAYVDRLMVQTLAQNTIFDRFATKGKTLPQKVGDTIRFKRWIPMRDLLLANSIYQAQTGNNTTVTGKNTLTMIDQNAYSSIVLPEGDSGTAQGQMKEMTMDFNVIPIGMWMSVPEETPLFHDAYTTQENIRQYGEVASLYIDGFYRDTYINGAGHVDDISAADGVTNATYIVDAGFTTAVKGISLKLRLSGAKYVDSILVQSPEYAKQGIWGRYIGILNTLAAEELYSNPDFKPVDQYPGGVKLLENEIGLLHDVRIITDPNGLIETTTTSGKYTAYMLIMGKEHSYDIPLRGKKRVEVVVQGLGKGGSDPLNRKFTVGWKSWLGAGTVYSERLGLVKVNFSA